MKLVRPTPSLGMAAFAFLLLVLDHRWTNLTWASASMAVGAYAMRGK